MKGLHKSAVKMTKSSMSWIEEDKRDSKRQDNIRATTKIILHLIEYMERNQMNQTDLAKKLGVSPQYIHKLLHGQDASFRIETALEYGDKLGIHLVEIPTISYYYSVDPSSLTYIWADPLSEINIFTLNGESNLIKSDNKQIWQPKPELVIA